MEEKMQTANKPGGSGQLSEKSEFVESKLIASRYLPIRELGRGMEGVVYLVEDIKVGGRLRALKQYHESGGDFAKKERDMLIQLRHPFMPELTDWIPPDEGLPGGAIVTSYISGETLESAFARAGRTMKEESVLRLGVQICLLLEYLHEHKPQPIIYRDLKPSNLLIDTRGYVHLVDFGSSRIYRPWGALDTVQLGTVGFAAPEQFELRQSDERTDLYTLGALMYYLLHGGKPHYFRQGDNDKPKDKSVRPTVRKIVNKLLEHRPADRFPSAATTRLALEAELAAASTRLFFRRDRY